MEEDFYDTSEDLTRTARSTDLTGVGKSQLQHDPGESGQEFNNNAGVQQTQTGSTGGSANENRGVSMANATILTDQQDSMDEVQFIETRLPLGKALLPGGSFQKARDLIRTATITGTERQDQFNDDSTANVTSRHDKNPRTLQDQNTDWLSYLLIMDQLHEFGLADRKAPRKRHRKRLLNMEQLHEFGLADRKAPRIRYRKVLLTMEQLQECGLADRKAPRIRHRKDLLNMEQLHEYGLAKIPKAPRTRYGKVWWFPPAQSHIAIIPKRVIDDPPDLDEATNSFWDLIVKLSKNNNEDDLSR